MAQRLFCSLRFGEIIHKIVYNMNNIKFDISYKCSENTPNRQGKRRLITEDELKIELRSELLRLFKVFKESVEMYNKSVLPLVMVGQMVRNFEATSFNQCLVTNAFKEFPEGCAFGKYAKFNLRLSNGTIVQFKKLNGKGMPMNIKTINVDSINNQLALDLFGDQNLYDPILYFGYKKDRIGQFIDPQIVYIDEGKIVFSMTEEQLNSLSTNDFDIVVDNNVLSGDVRIKNNKLRKIAN